MRTMYDAVTAANIPPDAQMVAGYCDTIKIPQWTDADWARFPNAIKVRIAKKASTNDGHVLDVELGDATPAEAPGWVTMRRAAGADPTVYCNASTWPAVRAAFAAAKVTEPHYWIAKYDGVTELPAGAVAKQHSDGAKFDTSSVAANWPGVDPAPAGGGSAPGNPNEEDPVQLNAGTDVHACVFVKGKTQLYICTADLGDTPVMLTSVDFYGDTPKGVLGGAGVGGAIRSQVIDPHRPGPLPIPAGAIMAQIRYTANHSFGVGLS